MDSLAGGRFRDLALELLETSSNSGWFFGLPRALGEALALGLASALGFGFALAFAAVAFALAAALALALASALAAAFAPGSVRCRFAGGAAGSAVSMCVCTHTP